MFDIFKNLSVPHQAIIEFIFTLIGSYFQSKSMKANFWRVLIVSLGLGILFHRLFGIRTPIDKAIFR